MPFSPKKILTFVMSLALFVFASPVFPKEKRDKPPEKLWSEVLRLRAQERWVKAAQVYKKYFETLSEEEQKEKTEEAAEIFFKARLYNEAAGQYSKLASEKNRKDLENILDKLVSAYARSNQFDEALERLEELKKISTKDTARLEYRRAFILTDANRCKKAIPVFQEFRREHPKHPKADEALWHELWCEYQEGEPNAALKLLEEYEEHYGSRVPAGRILFWRYHFLKSAGKKQEALVLRKKIFGMGDNFYSLWFKKTEKLPEGRCPSWPTNEDRTDHALEEVQRFSPAPSTEIQKWASHFSKKEKVSLAVLLGLMAQESHFRPHAVSPVGAVGLMQLMPETAYDTAEDLGWENFQTEDLKQMKANLTLGTHYLKLLMEKFSGDIVRLLAAYNAGPEAVERWTHLRQNCTCEEFMEAIPYKETHQYVQKVLKNIWRLE